MKIAIAFILFAALSLFVIMKGGDSLDMSGEKHGGDHGPAPAAAASAPAGDASAPAAAPAAPASAAK